MDVVNFVMIGPGSWLLTCAVRGAAGDAMRIADRVTVEGSVIKSARIRALESRAGIALNSIVQWPSDEVYINGVCVMALIHNKIWLELQ